jgi:hypothetical protein
VSREKLRKRIVQYGLRAASADEKGHPLYWIVDLVRAVDGQPGSECGRAVDPSKMTAGARNAWYQSEHRRLDFEEREGTLCRVEDARREISRGVLEFASFLDSLPDVLERDAGLTADQVEGLIHSLDRERERLWQKMAHAQHRPQVEVGISTGIACPFVEDHHASVASKPK